MAAADDKVVEKIIEIETEVLSNSQAAIMLLCGAVAGAFCLWALYEYQKSEKSKRVGLSVVEPDYEDGDPPEPQRRGANAFTRFAGGEAGQD